jgi:crotonobetainyl-CoA:carnitine CoA-transferase CaiB-like acyl-CoA transferase
LKYLYEARDGWVAAMNGGGVQGPSSGAIIDWMSASGEDGGLASPRWRERLATMGPLEEDERAFIEPIVEAFCRTRDKVPLVEEAQRRGSGWAPVFSPREIVECDQLAARDYWVWVRHDDLGESFLYPGAPWKLGATPWAQRGRAPHLGEHNEQVYGELLGIQPAELRRLRLKMVV